MEEMGRKGERRQSRQALKKKRQNGRNTIQVFNRVKGGDKTRRWVSRELVFRGVIKTGEKKRGRRGKLRVGLSGGAG